MKWTPISEDVEQRLEFELQSWKGTRYSSGQKVKRVGVDCIRFVCSVLDSMAGTKTDFESLPCDAHLHVPEKAKSAMHKLLSKFPCEKVEDLNFVEPGDILVVGTKQAPGHAMIAGTKQDQLWHQDGSQVCWTSRLTFGSVLHKIYRPSKDNW